MNETIKRVVTDHIINPENDRVYIHVEDDPGPGGANHVYEFGFVDIEDSTGHNDWRTCLKFQKGPVAEHGINGITQEVLLAVVADRLRSFQSGPFACRDNAVALTHVETALLWLQKRTLDRMRRGVEGQSKV